LENNQLQAAWIMIEAFGRILNQWNQFQKHESVPIHNKIVELV